MDTALTDGRDRLDYVKKRLTAFDKDIFEFLSSKYTFYSDEYTNGTAFKREYKFRVREGDLPPDLRFAFCDIVHHLASTCDNLLYALQLNYKVQRPRSNFPYYLKRTGKPSEQTFDRWDKRHPQIPPKVKQAIELLQPFTSCTFAGETAIGKQHPIYILYKLWNEDKHAAPLTVQAAMNEIHLNTPAGKGSLFAHLMEFHPNTPLIDGAVFATFITDKSFVFPITVPVYVVLDQNSPIAPSAKAFQLLDQLHGFVEGTVFKTLSSFL